MGGPGPPLNLRIGNRDPWGPPHNAYDSQYIPHFFLFKLRFPWINGGEELEILHFHYEFGEQNEELFASLPRG